MILLQITEAGQKILEDDRLINTLESTKEILLISRFNLRFLMHSVVVEYMLKRYMLS